MPDGNSIGSVYIEIGIRADQLGKDLREQEKLIVDTAKKFETAFRNIKLDFDNKLMITKFNDLEKLHAKLTTILERKINVNADVASLERTKIQIESVQKALDRFKPAKITLEADLAKMTILEVSNLSKKLQIELQQKIKMNVPIGELNELKQGILRAEGSLAGLKGVSSGFNMVGTNTARLFSDMGYFATSASFGIMSVGNNISPLIESFQMARARGQSFKEILMSTFTGTSGWLVGINILVSAITAYSIATGDSKNKTDESKKSISDLVETYKNLQEKIAATNEELAKTKAMDFAATWRALNTELKNSQKEYDELIKKQKEFNSIQKTNPIGQQGQSLSPLSFFSMPSKKEQKEFADELKKKEENVKELNRLGNLIYDAGKAYGKGDFTQFLKNTADKDVEFVMNVYKDWGSRINSYNKGVFSAFNRDITTSKENAKGLVDQLEKAFKPKTKTTKETSSENIIDSMNDKALAAENELQKLKINNLKDGLEKSLKNIEHEYKEKKEAIEKSLRDEQQAIEKARKDKNLPKGELAKAESVSITTTQSLKGSIVQIAIEEENEKKKIRDEYEQKRVDEENKWNDIIAQHAAKAIENELESKIATIRVSYQKLYDDLNKAENLTPREKKHIRTGLKTSEQGEITDATSDYNKRTGSEMSGYNKEFYQYYKSRGGPLSPKDLSDEISRGNKELNDLLEKFESGKRLAGDFANTISSGFINGITSGENFGKTLERLAIQMASMVAQALLFEALFSLFAPIGATSGGIFQGLFKASGGGVNANKPSGYIVPNNMIASNNSSASFYSSSTNNFSDSNIVGEIKNLNSRITALANRPLVSNVYLNKKLVGRSISLQQYQDTNSNVKVY